MVRDAEAHGSSMPPPGSRVRSVLMVDPTPAGSMPWFVSAARTRRPPPGATPPSAAGAANTSVSTGSRRGPASHDPKGEQPPMAVIAFVTWLLAGGVGFMLLVTWIANGGHRRDQTTRSRLPPVVLFGHLVLASVGLVIWIVYLVSRSDALAWLSLAVVAVVVSLGSLMFFGWLPPTRANRSAGGAEDTYATAEAGLPVGAVFVHGLFAVATLLLVLLTALRS
jgi:hypothetical protein